MKSCFGKRKKTPEQNAQCFLVCNFLIINLACISLISQEEGKKKSKDIKTYMKYKTRIIKILNGEYSKVPNTLVRLNNLVRQIK